MKKIGYILAAVLAVLTIVSCDDDRTGPMSQNINWGNGLRFDEETALKKLIVRDVLGYAVSTSVNTTIYGSEEDVSAITINAAYTTSEKQINDTYVFADRDERDSLTITASGKREKINTSSSDVTIVNFSPLNLTFDFDNFVFINACGMRAYLKGSIECRANGKFNQSTQEFKGTATCMDGGVNKTDELVYVYENEEERAITMTVNVSIDGDVLDINSYSFSGTAFVDGRLMTVDNAFDTESVCPSLLDN